MFRSGSKRDVARSITYAIIKVILFSFSIVQSFIYTSCNSKRSSSIAPLFSEIDSSGIKFQNTVTDSRLENSFYFRNFYNGGGVAIGDINNDSLCDVLLTSNMGENKLYLNKGDFRFLDITAQSGFKQDSMWSTGVVMVDINSDGWLDIYVCNSGNMQNGYRKNKLYINNRDLSFTEAAAQYGLDHSGYCTQASFFDYDMDGDLDCLLINNSPIPFGSLNYADMRDKDISEWEVQDNLKGGGNHLYRNDNGFYIEVTRETGLHSGLISFGLGVSVGDINNDNYPDIYVGNDFIERDYLYINQKNGRFSDELVNYVQQISMSSMSSDIADINNDGYPEIFTTDMIPEDDYRLKTTGTFDNIDLYLSKQKAGLYHQYVKNALQLNNGNGTFSEIGYYSGVDATDWSWGALFLDADNDGLNDIFVCNGINRDLGDLDFLDFFSNEVQRKMLETGKRVEIDELLKHIPVNPLPNKVYKNNGNLRFTDIGNAWGLGKPGFSNSAAYGDLDNDGDLDLVINNENQPAFVYRNNSRQQNGNSYIGVMLRGKGGNSYAIGSKIKVYRGGEIYYREVVPSRGFQSSVDYKQIIGLGKAGSVDSVVIIWPDRSYSRYDSPSLNEVHVWEQPSGKSPVAAVEQSVSGHTIFAAVQDNVFEKHIEDEYIDFYYERNLPAMLSREGPGVARGDVNGDGLEDVYIGGSGGQSGQLYVQSAGGGFTRREQAVFRSYADFEDVAALLFDADKDGDLDLYLGAGGNNVRPHGRELQHRLYINDGHGEFSIDTKAFPPNDMNISVAVHYDFDGDGDEDLYVGGRSVPYHYGVTPRSYVYRNDGRGHFTEMVEGAGDLLQAGMITGAVWADVNADAGRELVITGEWMTTRIFSYNKVHDRFEEQKDTGLEKLWGWWQTVSAADVNADGRVDLLIGNIGENFYLRPTASAPARLWLNDFDGNGSREQFLTRTAGGRDVPVFLKREITEQFPGLKKQNLRHSDYAGKSIQQLFSSEVIGTSETRQFNYCSSVVAINEGNGRFKVEALPQMVQLSSVNAIEVMDINADGKMDIIAGGNKFVFPPQFGRVDASYGHVLINNGDGRYRWISPAQSGISLRGEIKAIISIKDNNNGSYLLVAQNNELPEIYKIARGK